MSTSDANSMRRLFVNILRNSAQSYKASAEVTTRYADMIESGTISPKDVEDLTKYPGFMSMTPSDVGSSKQNKNKKKDREEDLKVIMFKPSVQGDDGDSKKRKRPSKKLKDPNAPKRPPNAFFLFQNSIFSETKNENPEMSYKEVQQEISKMWAELGAEGKKPYQGAAEIAKVDYEKLKGEYEAGLAAAALEGDLLRDEEDSDDAVSVKSAFVKGKSSTSTGKGSTSKMKKDKKKTAVTRLLPAPAPTSTSTDADTSVDEIDSDSEEEEPPKKKVKKHVSPSPSPARAKKDDKENRKLRK